MMNSEASPPIADADVRRLLWSWLLTWFSRALLFLTLCWLAGLEILALSMRFVGESNLTTGFCLFLPPVLWLLPGVVLWPMLLLFRWRAALVCGVLACLIFLMHSGWRPGEEAARLPRDRRADGDLVVLTNNRGQAGGHSLQPFKNDIQPDIMVFQESMTPAVRYLMDPGYAEFKNGQSIGEFSILSRFPVSAGRLLSWQGRNGRPVNYAARFEVDWNGRRIAVYVVHLRSPRDALLAMRWGGFVRGIPLPLTSWRERAAQDRAFWLDQLAIAQELEHQVLTDPLPCIAAGDFNAPHLGLIHRLLTRSLSDAHTQAGHGFGFTFPGDSRNPLALGGPWLRIDHILADSRWEMAECWTEGMRKSQHRAVAALLRLPLKK